MRLRFVAGALGALALMAPAAHAQDSVPLAGKGEDVQPIARVPLAGANEVEMAGDWAFVSLDETEDASGGLAIVNVADPLRPRVQSVWRASSANLDDASYGDVDLSTDGNLAVLTNAHCGDCEEGEVHWAALIDVTDKSAPRLVGTIVDDETMDYVHTATLDDTTLYLNPQVAGFYPQPGNAHISVFDVSDPSKPVKKGTIAPPSADAGLAHDSYIDHRPDGRSLLYAASIHKTDVMDVTDPLKPTYLQSTTSPQYSLSHDAQPSHDRKLIVVDDEGAAGGQLSERVSACGKVGQGPASADSGSVHFFEAAPDGTFARGGAVHLGSFNAPTNVNTGACVAHVFWQAPDENRLTQAYYRTGAFVLDFEDPADAQMLGWFVADGGSIYWSNKPHRGYLFASDMEHGLDVLRYTGEGGTRWPTTAGPAEVQRAARQGVPYVPIATPSTAPLPAPPAPSAAASRALGRFAFKATSRRVPGRRGRTVRLSLTIRDAAGKVVGKTAVRRAAGRKTTVRARGVAVSGRYTWRLTAGRKVLDRGRISVKRGDGLSLSPGQKLVASAK